MRLQKPQLELVHEAVRKLVKLHYPEEVPYFPLIWEQFLEMQEQALSPIERNAGWIERFRIGLPFDEERAINLVAPVALIAVAATLLQTGRVSASTLESIQEDLRACARVLRASRKLEKNLVGVVAPMLQVWATSIRGNVSSLEETKPVIGGEKVEVWVEMSKRGESVVIAEYYTQRELERDVCPESRQFDLYIDERKCAIRVAAKRGLDIPWRKVQPRCKRLLGMVFDAFRDSKTLVKYEDIASVIFDEAIIHVLDKCKNLSADLNSQLKGVLSRIVSANRKQQQLDLALEEFGYCWVRPSKEDSLLYRLFPSSPAKA